MRVFGHKTREGGKVGGGFAETQKGIAIKRVKVLLVDYVRDRARSSISREGRGGQIAQLVRMSISF